VTSPLSPDGAFLRKLAFLGASRGPTALLRGAPPLFGALFWALRPRHRRGVRKNLRRIFGPRPLLRERTDEIATFVAFARSFAEAFAALGPRADDVRVEVDDPHIVQSLLQEGKGVIFVTAHTSSFELAGAALGRALDAHVVMAMRAEPNARARAISDEARKRGGLSIVHVGDDPLAALALVDPLRHGGVVALQIDRMPPGSRGVPVTLFGHRIEMPMGPFVLARATGAPILPVFTRRTGFLTARVHPCAPIRLDKRASREDIAVAAQEVADALEAWIREAPTEWLDWGGA
jgi:phosphatidylinositol dimannoside acyltransferase